MEGYFVSDKEVKAARTCGVRKVFADTVCAKMYCHIVQVISRQFLNAFIISKYQRGGLTIA